ncbi:unnamed protein product [Lampetra fluviatilis]
MSQRARREPGRWRRLRPPTLIGGWRCRRLPGRRGSTFRHGGCGRVDAGDRCDSEAEPAALFQLGDNMGPARGAMEAHERVAQPRADGSAGDGALSIAVSQLPLYCKLRRELNMGPCSQPHPRIHLPGDSAGPSVPNASANCLYSFVGMAAQAEEPQPGALYSEVNCKRATPGPTSEEATLYSTVGPTVSPAPALGSHWVPDTAMFLCEHCMCLRCGVSRALVATAVHLLAPAVLQLERDGGQRPLAALEMLMSRRKRWLGGDPAEVHVSRTSARPRVPVWGHQATYTGANLGGFEEEEALVELEPHEATTRFMVDYEENSQTISCCCCSVGVDTAAGVGGHCRSRRGQLLRQHLAILIVTMMKV